MDRTLYFATVTRMTELRFCFFRVALILCAYTRKLLLFFLYTQKVVGQEIGLAHKNQKVGGQLPALPNRLRRQ